MPHLLVPWSGDLPPPGLPSGLQVAVQWQAELGVTRWLLSFELNQVNGLQCYKQLGKPVWEAANTRLCSWFCFFLALVICVENVQPALLPPQFPMTFNSELITLKEGNTLSISVKTAADAEDGKPSKALTNLGNHGRQLNGLCHIV